MNNFKFNLNEVQQGEKYGAFWFLKFASN